MRKSRHVRAKVFYISQLSLLAITAASMYFGFLKSVYQHSPAALIVGVITVQFSLLGLLLVGKFETLEEVFFRRLGPIADRETEVLRGKKLSAKEFYYDFLRHSTAASRRVNITWLASSPPEDFATPSKQYTRSITAALKRNKDVVVRRIVRNSPNNQAWIEELAKVFTGLPNAYLAILDDSDGEEMPLALSVQIVDDEHCWIVAAASHTDEKGPRDLYFSGRDIVDVLSGYHDRLWTKCRVVVDAGRLATKVGRTTNE